MASRVSRVASFVGLGLGLVGLGLGLASQASRVYLWLGVTFRENSRNAMSRCGYVP